MICQNLEMSFCEQVFNAGLIIRIRKAYSVDMCTRIARKLVKWPDWLPIVRTFNSIRLAIDMLVRWSSLIIRAVDAGLVCKLIDTVFSFLPILSSIRLIESVRIFLFSLNPPFSPSLFLTVFGWQIAFK